MKPDQLSGVNLPRDATLQELKKLALRAHLEARQSADLRRDLARCVLPSDGPYAHGDRVFVWIDDKAKYKAIGRWARARVIAKNGAIVDVETDKAVLRVNQSKVRVLVINGNGLHHVAIIIRECTTIPVGGRSNQSTRLSFPIVFQNIKS